ncbi:MAG: KH domain-containing protein [Clostridia bacterium]|nr:KH domain-containing protein [Clostridia bacterium]
MIKEATGIGATPEEALANARAALGAPFDAEVHTEIIEMPKKKILGLFGGAPAKARAYYEVAEEKKPQPKAKAPSQKAAKAEKAAKKAEEKKEPVQVKEKEAEEIRKSVALDSNSTLKAAADYLKEIVTGMGVAQVSIEAFETGENEVILELDCGEDYGVVIGRRGETLDAIQYLTRLSANKKKGDSDYARISVNVGNYREKRKNTLSELAKKNASKVLKYGRNVTFEPMNPYERRIIHTTIQEIEGVTSYSVGSDSDRRVVITLEEGVKPTHPSKGGYNRGRSGNNRGRRSNGGNRSRNSSAVTSAPTRAPKTDAGAQGVSLYGKIN